MNTQVLSHFPMPWLTCVALLLFFSLFVTLFARAYAKANKELYRQIEQLPLSEDGERHE